MTMTVASTSTIFEHAPQGPFDLGLQNEYFGGWPTLESGEILMTFPVEGWEGSAAVAVSQCDDGALVGRIWGPDIVRTAAWNQALATLSADVDGRDWPAVGERDEFIGRLQHTYQWLRPVLFHSPYEAVMAFLLGHRISIVQRRRLMAKIAESMGDRVEVGDAVYHAFPRPEVIAQVDTLPGVSDLKVTRVKAAAAAAARGMLDRDRLLKLPADQALAELCELPGVGPFFAQGILFRGAGIVDHVTDDPTSREAVTRAYQLDDRLDDDTWNTLTSAWAPFGMWAMVLLHIWVRREDGGFRRAGK